MTIRDYIGERLGYPMYGYAYRGKILCPRCNEQPCSVKEHWSFDNDVLVFVCRKCGQFEHEPSDIIKVDVG